ncbi:MAG: phosphotransferase family protein [Rhodospirillaceae bacterium]|jgi:aminoglycoside phosphotransferase (APT) family kinase protein|nr:phosphotransferase family protein [Rhodospirillaceae bacterium]MBT4043573.1 phosphotransferase family protein [Rhodospirillaceae bacterium]MBT4690959.1 phosphotransferase family protein [Rhodospirillaceae bacterium]MBT5079987.1 phosphotransferase family protein [Rhodospirillaceae bacterium]MBT5526009.1 phosphotransferase family protein [Rhodospirillaceae bacterium]
MTADIAENRAEVQSRTLTAVLNARVGQVYGPGTGIDGLVRLSGGASRETWSFDALLPDGRRLPLILKRDPLDEIDPGDADVNLGIDRWTEGRLMQLAREAGVPAPEVPFFLDADDRTSAGFVSQRLEGEALGRRIVREDEFTQARAKLAFQCGEAAARFHAIPLDKLPPLRNLPVAAALDYNQGVIDAFGQPHAGFEYAFRWLRERLELAGDRLTLCHGDYRNGNLLVDHAGLAGVLDWELGHLGNPISDLGWICIRAWRYGYYDNPVGGFGAVEDLLDGYEAGGGGRVSLETLRFWEVFGCMRWGVICMTLAFAHLEGRERSVEKVSIGRRAVEGEYDLLQLVD